MKLPRIGMRGIIAVLASGVALAGLAWGGYAYLLPAKYTPIPPALEQIEVVETPKSKHPPIAAIRKRMLIEFHGAATNTFTAIPGFGFERMRPFYRKIPFELPYLSTAELEIDPGPREVPATMKPVLEKALAEFASPTPVDAAPVKREFPPFGPQENGLGHSIRGAIAHGMQLRMLDLVGLTDKEAPKVYSGGEAFELIRVSFEESKKGGKLPLKKLIAVTAEHDEVMKALTWEQKDAETSKAPSSPATRPLDSFEVMGVAELSAGKSVFIRTKGNVTRMLGALRAADSCLKCHNEALKGDLLGAFSYTFVDTSKPERDAPKK